MGHHQHHHNDHHHHHHHQHHHHHTITTIIRVTVKKCQQLTPRFATCMYVYPIYQPSHHHKSNCQKVSTAHPQICHLYVCMTYIPALTPSRTDAHKHTQTHKHTHKHTNTHK